VKCGTSNVCQDALDGYGKKTRTIVGPLYPWHRKRHPLRDIDIVIAPFFLDLFRDYITKVVVELPRSNRRRCGWWPISSIRAMAISLVKKQVLFFQAGVRIEAHALPPWKPSWSIRPDNSRSSFLLWGDSLRVLCIEVLRLEMENRPTQRPTINHRLFYPA